MAAVGYRAFHVMTTEIARQKMVDKRWPGKKMEVRLKNGRKGDHRFPRAFLVNPILLSCIRLHSHTSDYSFCLTIMYETGEYKMCDNIKQGFSLSISRKPSQKYIDEFIGNKELSYTINKLNVTNCMLKMEYKYNMFLSNRPK